MQNIAEGNLKDSDFELRDPLTERSYKKLLVYDWDYVAYEQLKYAIESFEPDVAECASARYADLQDTTAYNSVSDRMREKNREDLQLIK